MRVLPEWILKKAPNPTTNQEIKYDIITCCHSPTLLMTSHLLFPVSSWYQYTVNKTIFFKCHDKFYKPGRDLSSRTEIDHERINVVVLELF